MITATFAGLTAGAIYALIAIGYNITLVSSGVLNFAFANTLILGGYFALAGLSVGLPLPLALLLAAIGCGLVSVILERAAIRFLPSGSHAELITTLGAGTAITAITALIWGGDALRLTLFEQTPVIVGQLQVPPISLVIIALPIIFGVGLHLIMRRTRFGLISRAQAYDREASMVRGVDVRWLSVAAFAIAGVFAGIVGPFVLMSTTASPWLVWTFAIKGFVVLALGGLGSQIGAIIAGALIGLTEAFVALTLGSFYGEYAVFVIFLIVLLAWPTGLFGNRVQRAV